MVAKFCSRSHGHPPSGLRSRAMMASSSSMSVSLTSSRASGRSFMPAKLCQGAHASKPSRAAPTAFLATIQDTYKQYYEKYPVDDFDGRLGFGSYSAPNAAA